MDTDELKENQDGLTMSEENQTENDEAVAAETEAENSAAEPENDTVTFEDLGLDEYTLKAVERKGFVTPSPIQVLAIPRLLNGDTNLIARARTGTGKTAAFGLPIIQAIKDKSKNVEALILEPTRELAMQTCEEMKSFSNNGIPRTTVLYGGASYAQQIRELKQGCEIVVGTPGRIKDHLERKTLDLSKIKYFILDEGDEMLDMGFIDDIRDIFQQSNAEARILLFSATMPAPILKIAADFMGEYDIIEEEKVVDEALLIEQKYWYVKESDKVEALIRLIDMSPDFYGIVFTMTKNDADRVTRDLDMRGYEAAALHGDIMQNQREKVIERFRLKKTRILVATDVAARGIDISGLTHVVNFSLPFDTATYVHRIGRTGRAGTTGIAVTFVRPEERKKMGYFTKNTERATKGKLEEGKIPNINEVLTIKENRLFDELREKIFLAVPAEEPSSSETDTTAEAAENAVPEAAPELTSTTTADSTSETEADSAAETVSAVIANTAAANSDASISEAAAPESPKLIESAEKYHELAKNLCENQNAEDVLAAVLSMIYGEKLSPKHYGKISTRDMGPRGDQMRIFVSLGKQDGYHAREIANYFSELLHIPGRMVDDIDVAQQFSLLTLPVASAKKAIEMSRSNKKLPHMHIDSKEEGRGTRKGGRGEGGRRSDFGDERRERRPRRDGDSGRRDFRSRDDRERSRDDNSSRSGRSKGDRPNFHNQSERTSSRKSGGASAFVKKGKKAERF